MDKKPEIKPKWLDRYDILDPQHINDLETSAAVNEFSHKMRRHDAEDKAHKDYTRERVIDAAAHHLAGQKAAQGAGDMEASRRHGLMYQMALKHLGHPIVGEAPAEIVNRMKHGEENKIYKFKGHAADSFMAEPETLNKSTDELWDEMFNQNDRAEAIKGITAIIKGKLVDAILAKQK